MRTSSVEYLLSKGEIGGRGLKSGKIYNFLKPQWNNSS